MAIPPRKLVIHRFPYYSIEDVWTTNRSDQKVMAITSHHITMFFTSNNPILVLFCFGLIIELKRTKYRFESYIKLRDKIEKMLGVING